MIIEFIGCVQDYLLTDTCTHTHTHTQIIIYMPVINKCGQTHSFNMKIQKFKTQFRPVISNTFTSFLFHMYSNSKSYIIFIADQGRLSTVISESFRDSFFVNVVITAIAHNKLINNQNDEIMLTNIQQSCFPMRMCLHFITRRLDGFTGLNRLLYRCLILTGPLLQDEPTGY